MAFYRVDIPRRTATRYMREAGRDTGQRLAHTRTSKATVAEKHAASAVNAIRLRSDAMWMAGNWATLLASKVAGHNPISVRHECRNAGYAWAADPAHLAINCQLRAVVMKARVVDLPNQSVLVCPECGTNAACQCGLKPITRAEYAVRNHPEKSDALLSKETGLDRRTLAKARKLQHEHGAHVDELAPPPRGRMLSV